MPPSNDFKHYCYCCIYYCMDTHPSDHLSIRVHLCCMNRYLCECNVCILCTCTSTQPTGIHGPCMTEQLYLVSCILMPFVFIMPCRNSSARYVGTTVIGEGGLLSATLRSGVISMECAVLVYQTLRISMKLHQ